METFTAEPFLDLQCGLAEGPFWDEKTNTLRFVDIKKQAVWWVDLHVGASSAKKRDYDISIAVTAALANSDDSFVFGGKHGIGIAQKNSNEYKYIQRFWTEKEVNEQDQENRFRANDGAVDSQGRFWVSAMNDSLVTEVGPNGVLFRLDVDGQFHRVIENVTIPNGMSWSQDDKIFYFTDSVTKNIFAYDFDTATGAISNKRVFFHVEEGGGLPDGHTQDVDGNLWVAIWGGWKVVRVSPEGKVTAEIAVPTRCPTAAVIAGRDIYITSEADPEADKYPDSKRYQGAVFKCHVGVRGRQSHSARIAG